MSDSTLWSDINEADPLKDLETALEAIEKETEFKFAPLCYGEYDDNNTNCKYPICGDWAFLCKRFVEESNNDNSL
jgi:hypothetical protein